MRRAGRLAASGTLRVTVTILALAAAFGLRPAAARAAFDLRQATPEAIGAASMDLPFDILEADSSAEGSLTATASHASLYDVEGLAADRLGVGWRFGETFFDATWARVGTPDLAEVSHALSWRETGGRALRLRAHVERLSLGIAGEKGSSEWAAGGGATARVRGQRLVAEFTIEADRPVRGARLSSLGAEPAALYCLKVRANGITLAAGDRWEAGGRRSPRVALEVPVGSAVSLRAGRGESPGRIGFALSARWGRLALSAGRMDDDAGGVITSAGVRLLGKERGRPASPPGRPHDLERARWGARRSAEQNELLGVGSSGSPEAVPLI